MPWLDAMAKKGVNKSAKSFDWKVCHLVRREYIDISEYAETDFIPTKRSSVGIRFD